VQILHSHTDSCSVIGQLVRRLEIPCDDGESHGRMLERLQAHLHSRMDRKQPVVLIVDEAQTLSDEALESLRLLSNFDTSFEKVIQIVLIGQPELRERIRSSRHTALRQRIAMAKQLWPLSAGDTAEYIAHRLKAAAVDPEQVGVTFTDEAIAEIYEVTAGIPRLINVVCDNCLLLGMVRKINEIDAPMVHRVRQDMVPQFDDPIATSADLTGSLSLAG
jgi:general secretion pathway protein A